MTKSKEEQKIYQIVLTGGPCSGKTSALNRLKILFEKNFIVYRVPELATLTLESGVNLLPSSYETKIHS